MLDVEWAREISQGIRLFLYCRCLGRTCDGDTTTIETFMSELCTIRVAVKWFVIWNV